MKLPSALGALFRARQPRSGAQPARPAWLVPFLSYISRLPMENLGVLGLLRDRISTGPTPPAAALGLLVSARLGPDGNTNFYLRRVERAEAAARHAVRRAVAAETEYAPSDDHLASIEAAAVDLAAALALHSELSEEEFDAVWAPYENALPPLADLRPDRAFWLRDAGDFTEVMVAGGVEGAIVEGQQAMPRAEWSGLCPTCGVQVPLEWQQARTSQVAFCPSCPTVFVVQSASADRIASIDAARITAVRFFTRGSLAEAETGDLPYGPESDWIDALLRVAGEFAANTWAAIAANYQGPRLAREWPPEPVMEIGEGGVFRRRLERAKGAIEKVVRRDLRGLDGNEQRLISSILTQIAYDMLGRTYGLGGHESVGRLQNAMNAVRGGRARSVIEMLETEASVTASMRNMRRQTSV